MVIRSSAPDKVDYFDAILVGQCMGRVPIACDDFAIHFDRDTPRAEAEARDQVGNGRTRTNLVNLAVQQDAHGRNIDVALRLYNTGRSLVSGPGSPRRS